LAWWGGAQGAPSSLDFLNRTLGQAQSEGGKEAERLAGGRLLLADDPANNAIYDLLAGQLRSLAAEVGNRADLRSYYAFEEALLGDLVDQTQRLRELAARGGDGMLSPDDIASIHAEMDQIYDDELSALARAEFNGIRIFADFAQAGDVAARLASPDHYRQDRVDALLESLATERSLVGAKSQALDFELRGKAVQGESETSAYAQGDTDVGAAASAVARDWLLVAANLLML
jgi:hypothetical protein